MNSKHRELQRQNEMMQSQLQKLTNYVPTLTKQLNGAKLVNREMLNSVEKGVKGELKEQFILALAQIGGLF